LSIEAGRPIALTGASAPHSAGSVSARMPVREPFPPITIKPSMPRFSIVARA
jgi:hypothetical protein